MGTFLKNAVELLSEDAPVLDLTTHWLGFGRRPGRIRFKSRRHGVLSGVEAAKDLLEAAGCAVETSAEPGSALEPGAYFLEASGPAASLHRAWKAALSALDHCSGIATRTASLVENAAEGNPRCRVFTTRKHLPGIKDMAIKAILDGGAYPHRLGVSETVLIFDQHKAFFPNRDALCAFIAENKGACCEKKIMVEVADLAEAEAYLAAGADGVQFDKIPPDELTAIVRALRAGPHAGKTLIAAGGVNAANAAAFAAAGVDGLATSWPYDGAPLDMTAEIVPA